MLISRRVTFSIPGQAAGDLTYFNGTDWTRLPAGTNGYFLSLSGGLPVWAPVVSGDVRVRITGTGASVPVWTITGFFTGVTSAKAAEITMALETKTLTYQLVKAYILLTSTGVAQEEVYDLQGDDLFNDLTFTKSGDNLLVNMVFTESVDYRISLIEA
jgi:hypothetical protein